MSPDIAIAVLAAGQSRRFGSPKLLEDWQGRPLLQHTLAAAQQACPGNVVLVTGENADAVVAASAGLADSVRFNERFADGIGTSIAAAAGDCTADALIVMLADQPLVSAAHLANLVVANTRGTDGIIATAFSGVVGPPVLFGSDYVDELAQLTGDRGARAIIEKFRQVVVTVEFEPASIDIDTRADLDSLAER